MFKFLGLAVLIPHSCAFQKLHRNFPVDFCARERQIQWIRQMRTEVSRQSCLRSTGKLFQKRNYFCLWGTGEAKEWVLTLQMHEGLGPRRITVTAEGSSHHFLLLQDWRVTAEKHHFSSKHYLGLKLCCLFNELQIFRWREQRAQARFLAKGDFAPRSRDLLTLATNAPVIFSSTMQQCSSSAEVLKIVNHLFSLLGKKKITLLHTGGWT